jgi:hypothetical protein
MKCDRCNAVIPDGDATGLHGQTLCEDCYMDALSPAKACDPWAVYCAKSFSSADGARQHLTPAQEKILKALATTGGAPPEAVRSAVGLTPADFDRAVATLRHMERLRAELRDGVKVLCLW